MTSLWHSSVKNTRQVIIVNKGHRRYVPPSILEELKNIKQQNISKKHAIDNLEELNRELQTTLRIKRNEQEQQKFKNSVKGFCDSIRIVHRIFREDGKVVVGVYVVLDKVERFTQQIMLDAINQVLEMSEKTNQFIMKTF